MVYGKPYRQNANRLSAQVIIIALASLLLFLIFLQQYGVFKAMTGSLRGGINDRIVQSNIGIEARLPSNPDDLRAYAEALQSEVITLRHWRLAAKSMGQKITAYEHILNAQGPDSFLGAVTTQITSDTTGPFAFTYLVDAGQIHGVDLNGPVVNDHGLVGRIIRLGQTSSRVLSIRDFNSRIPVYGVESGSRAILYGGQDRYASLRDLPDQSQFTVNEEIFTSGAGGIFPRGIFIGEVTNMGETPEISLAMSRSNLGYVQILPARFTAVPEDSALPPIAPQTDPNPNPSDSDNSPGAQ